MTTAVRVDGADISHHQAKVDLKKAKESGLKFLYHKATEGDTYVDPRYSERFTQATRLGLPAGGYHFARAELGDAATEAKRFIKLIRPRPGDLKPALDLETAEGMSSKALEYWAREFSSVVLDLVGVLPVLYCPWEFGVKDQVLWVPRYNNTNTPPTIPWDIWQFSNGQFGKPNAYPGLGHVDLNTFGKGMTMNRLLIPEPRVTDMNVPMAHVSLQFSDKPEQQRRDAERCFARAQKRGLWWLTGTEAGNGSKLAAILKEVAPQYGYRIYVPRGTDSWIAVRKEVMTTKRWETAYDKVVDGVAKKFSGKGPVSVGFDTRLGPITVIACHYLTKGRPVDNPEYNQYLDINKRLAKAIGDLADEKARGKALVFYGGDQNIVDRTHDTFLGLANLTSCWDELQRWQNTGHGNIDVIASHDRDGRVECLRAWAMDDTDFPLFTDHYWVEAIYKIGALS